MDLEGESSVTLGPTSRGECLEALARPASGRVVRGWGFYYSPVFADSRYHAGVDIALEEGDRVRAALGGIVTEVSTTPWFGGRVTISHGFGVETVYAHLGTVLVREGQEVQTGEVVGLAGPPGLTEADLGVHLHYEIRVDGESIDPEPYLGG
jgi:murein DD-endopeptidase MepM/ murein hydrolase activator NlpD